MGLMTTLTTSADNVDGKYKKVKRMTATDNGFNVTVILRCLAECLQVNTCVAVQITAEGKPCSLYPLSDLRILLAGDGIFYMNSYLYTVTTTTTTTTTTPPTTTHNLLFKTTYFLIIHNHDNVSLFGIN